jgi:hypothetical protein
VTELQEEVTRERATAVIVDVIRVTVVHATVASTQEATTVQERAAAIPRF